MYNQTSYRFKIINSVQGVTLVGNVRETDSRGKLNGRLRGRYLQEEKLWEQLKRKNAMK